MCGTRSCVNASRSPSGQSGRPRNRLAWYALHRGECRAERSMSRQAAEGLVAAELVAARREGRSLTRFPGVVPASMAEAYQIQDLAMSQWQDSLVGWKIGYISAERRTAGSRDARLQRMHRDSALERRPWALRPTPRLSVEGTVTLSATDA